MLVWYRAHLEVVDGQEVSAGESLVEGPKDPKELLEVKGIRETQQYLVRRDARRLPGTRVCRSTTSASSGSSTRCSGGSRRRAR